MELLCRMRKIRHRNYRTGKDGKNAFRKVMPALLPVRFASAGPIISAVADSNLRLPSRQNDVMT